MSLVKEINNNLIYSTRELQVGVDVLCNNAHILSEDTIAICETAFSFLSHLKTKVKAHSLKINTHDHTVRDELGLLAALDLMRHPQARKAINSNSIRDFMNVIMDIEGTDSFSPIEHKLLSNLKNMYNDVGENGLEIQSKYLALLSDNNKILVDIIDKLNKQYRQIADKIHYSTSTYSTHTSIDTDNVIGA